MVMRFVYFSFVILTTIGSACQSNVTVDAPEYVSSIQLKRASKDSQFYNSPILAPENTADFKGLKYFDVNPNHKLIAKVIPISKELVEFKTNTERSPNYYSICKLEFEFEGNKGELTVYSEDTLNPQSVFIPFRDLSNNKTTYGGGRYIDCPFDIKSKQIELDFNTCYNPYCHYNTGYSCPLVPTNNFLNFTINSGEKMLYEDKH